MDVREQRQQAQNGDDLELQLLVAETLGQRVQPEEHDAKSEYDKKHDDGGDREQDIRVTGRRQKPRQVMRRCRVLHVGQRSPLGRQRATRSR
jgi:hypothetical protein